MMEHLLKWDMGKGGVLNALGVRDGKKRVMYEIYPPGQWRPEWLAFRDEEQIGKGELIPMLELCEETERKE